MLHIRKYVVVHSFSHRKNLRASRTDVNTSLSIESYVVQSIKIMNQDAIIQSEKVKIHFVAVGNAPMMKKNKFQIAVDQRFSSVVSFLRKMLQLESSASLFLYCCSAFVPGPEEMVSDLRDCFSVRGELVIHYSLQEAWG